MSTDDRTSLLASYIARASVAAIFVEVGRAEQIITSATAFVVRSAGRLWLITNRHVVTGRHQDTSECLDHHGRVPSWIEAHFLATGRLDLWTGVKFLLGDAEGRPAWYEHKTHGPKMDVIALPIPHPPGVDVPTFDLEPPERGLALGVTADVYVVGFPVGYSAYRNGAFAIWTRGSVASEPVIAIDGLPVFLVDARTRGGQSGSPVLAYARAGTTQVFTDGGIQVGGPETEQFLGVYSGRTHKDSDLGRVWHASAIQDLLDHPVRPEMPWVEPSPSP